MDNTTHDLYKTEYCRNWAELGNCRYGKKCRYAHGPHELRSIPRNKWYKTQICRAYHVHGACPYGVRCTYIHDFCNDQIQPRHIPVSPVAAPLRTESRFFNRTNTWSHSPPMSQHVPLHSNHSIVTIASTSTSSYTSSDEDLMEQILPGSFRLYSRYHT